MCTLRELETVYGLDDVADFHELLDIETELEESQTKGMQKGMPPVPRIPRAPSVR